MNLSSIRRTALAPIFSLAFLSMLIPSVAHADEMSAKKAYEQAKMTSMMTWMNLDMSVSMRKDAGKRYDDLLVEWGKVKGNLNAQQQADGDACFSKALTAYNNATWWINEVGPSLVSGDNHLGFSKAFLDVMSWNNAEASAGTAMEKYNMANGCLGACNEEIGYCNSHLNEAACWVMFAGMGMP